MTGTGERYLLRQMLAATGTASLFLTGTSQIRQDPMNRTLASADTAHYYQRPAQLSTLQLRPGRPQACRWYLIPARLRARPAPDPTVVGSDPNARAQVIDARTVLKSYRRDQR